MKRQLAGMALVLVLLGLLAPQARAGDTVYFVSLGDSFAVGYQPHGPQDQGYADQLLEIEQQHIPGLELVKLGCVGETTQAMIAGGGICSYEQGSQLNEALAFLEDHPGQIAFVTLDIGANDISRCQLHNLRYDQSCLPRIIDRLNSNLSFILEELRGAVGKDVPIVGAAYFDPWIGLWVFGPRGERIALADHEVFAMLNANLVDTYKAAGSPVADGWAAFSADDFTLVRDRHFGIVPHNVAVSCSWTWLCRIGDVHPNTVGYGALAEAFAEVLTI